MRKKIDTFFYKIKDKTLRLNTPINMEITILIGKIHLFLTNKEGFKNHTFLGTIGKILKYYLKVVKDFILYVISYPIVKVTKYLITQILNDCFLKQSIRNHKLQHETERQVEAGDMTRGEWRAMINKENGKITEILRLLEIFSD